MKIKNCHTLLLFLLILSCKVETILQRTPPILSEVNSLDISAMIFLLLFLVIVLLSIPMAFYLLIKIKRFMKSIDTAVNNQNDSPNYSGQTLRFLTEVNADHIKNLCKENSQQNKQAKLMLHQIALMSNQIEEVLKQTKKPEKKLRVKKEL